MTTIHPGGVPGGLSRSARRPDSRQHSRPGFDARVAVHRVPVLAAVMMCIAALYWWGWGAGVASAIRDLTGNAGPRQPGVITVRGQWLRIADDLALTAVAAAAFLVVRRLAGWGADSRQSDGAAATAAAGATSDDDAGAVVASADVAAADTSAGACADRDDAVVVADAVDVADLPRPRPRSLGRTHARARTHARVRLHVPARARLRAWWDAGFAYCWCMLAGFAAIDVASALIRTTFYAYPFATRFENGWAATLYLIGMFLAGPTEELVLLALPVVGLRHAGMPWWAVTCVAVALRVPFHLYYGWAAFAIGVWPVLAVLLFRRVGMITPMIVAHGMYDVSTAMTSLTGVTGAIWPVVLAAAIMATPVVWAVARIVAAVRSMRAARGADATHTRV